jgi:hypothetical protein
MPQMRKILVISCHDQIARVCINQLVKRGMSRVWVNVTQQIIGRHVEKMFHNGQIEDIDESVHNIVGGDSEWGVVEAAGEKVRNTVAQICCQEHRQPLGEQAHLYQIKNMYAFIQMSKNFQK